MELVLDLSPPESRHYRSWNERLRHVARYSRPEEIHVLLERAHTMGVRSVLAVLDPRTETALREFQTWREVEVWAVVPNMYAFIRDLTDRGMVGAALSRFLRLRPLAMLATGLDALRSLGPLARADFASGALWLAQMELAAASGLRIRRAFLHPQLTEIALAGRVKRLFTEFARRVRDQGMEPGLVTHNPVAASEVLGPDLDAFTAIVAPCNEKGYKMVPSRKAAEEVYRSLAGRFWASGLWHQRNARLEDTSEGLRRLPLGGVVLDVRWFGEAQARHVRAWPA
jgi:hypothetical protein